MENRQNKSREPEQQIWQILKQTVNGNYQTTL